MIRNAAYQLQNIFQEDFSQVKIKSDKSFAIDPTKVNFISLTPLRNLENHKIFPLENNTILESFSDLKNNIDLTSLYYQSKFNNRKIKWSSSLSKATIQVGKCKLEGNLLFISIIKLKSNIITFTCTTLQSNAFELR